MKNLHKYVVLYKKTPDLLYVRKPHRCTKKKYPTKQVLRELLLWTWSLAMKKRGSFPLSTFRQTPPNSSTSEAKVSLKDKSPASLILKIGASLSWDSFFEIFLLQYLWVKQLEMSVWDCLWQTTNQSFRPSRTANHSRVWCYYWGKSQGDHEVSRWSSK